MAKVQSAAEEILRLHREKSLKELGTIHEGLQAGDMEKTEHHKKIADLKIDGIVRVRQNIGAG